MPALFTCLAGRHRPGWAPCFAYTELSRIRRVCRLPGSIGAVMKKILINAILGAAVLGWLVLSDESVGHKVGVLVLALPGIIYAHRRTKRKQADTAAATINSFKR